MKKFVLLLIATVIFLPSMATDPDEIRHYADIRAIRQELAQRPLHTIEGIWRFPYNGAMILIERANDSPLFDCPDTYRMVVLRSPARSLLPGTEMGRLSATSDNRTFAASLYTDSDGGSRLYKAKEFTISLTGDSRLAFKRRGKRLSVQLWRLIPYLSRLHIRSHSGINVNDDGCVKIYPIPADAPSSPIYL